MNRFDLEKYSDKEVKKLADQGVPAAIMEYGFRMNGKERYKEAFKYFYKLKDRDNIVVYEQLISIAYFDVKGIISDKELFELLEKRQSKGISYYTYLLAHAHKDGRGTRKSIKKYIYYLTLVANDGYCTAVVELAECYENGFGVRKSLRKAFHLYYSFYDEHGRLDYWCAYKSALYMLNGWGGAKKEMWSIEYHLKYASRVYGEAKRLYIELFNKEPE